MRPAILQSISVSFEYPVYFGDGVLAPDSTMLRDAIAARAPSRRHRLVVLVDEGVARAQPDLLQRVVAYVAAHQGTLELAAEPRLVPGGERAKNEPEHATALHAELDRLHVDRHGYVVAIGGGAMLDLVGWVAATTHRGVRLVRLPTTVLSQADSGVGVKNGVNAFGKKNFLGTFAPPAAVVIDSAFLATLAPRDTRAGMAEAVKVALIRDAGFFAWLEAERVPLAACQHAAVTELVRRCAELHLCHIATSGDPFELGSARPLDFGHWAAHKLEVLTDHRLRHGEAVAIGIALDTVYSATIGLCEQSVARAVLALLGDLGLPRWDDALAGGEAVLAGLDEFREHLGGDLTVTLLAEIGRGVEVREMDRAQIVRAIERLRAESRP